MSPTPASEKSLAARANAELSWAATTDRAARTANGRAALRQRFLDKADGDPVRAEHLWKAHFANLALKSARARRRARELKEEAQATDAQLRDLAGGPDAA